MAEHRYPERTVAPPSGQPSTVGLQVPHELPAGAAGLRDYAARAEAAGIDRLFTGDHVAFQGGRRRLVFGVGLGGEDPADADRDIPAWQRQIAESLRPYVEAGCRSFKLISVADSQQAAIDGAAEIRALLRSEPR